MRGRRRNSFAGAAALSSAFHGRPAATATDDFEEVYYHKNLAELGELKELELLVDEKHVLQVEFSGALLCASENGRQLYVLGGDQELDLGAVGVEGEEAEKDLVTVAPVYSVTYATGKDHLGAEDRKHGPYYHIFGEEGGTLPTLVYDRLNKKVSFAGGTYHIDRDMEGMFSAGIRD